MGKSKFQISRTLDERIKRIISGNNEEDTEFAQVQSAYILGFNYGNLTNCVGLTTNYQLHHAVFPVVGLVFFTKSPSDEEIKSSLRSVKEYSSSPNGLGSFKSDKNEHLFLIYSIDKNSNEVEKRIFNFSKGSFVRRRRLRLNVLDDPYCPNQLNGGPEDLFKLDDADSLSSAGDDHVDHLIFFIHGVGGVCDVRFRSCVEVVADFKKMANNLLAQHSNPASGTSTPASNVQLSTHLKKGFFRKQSSESTTSDRNSETTETSRHSNPQGRARKVECLPISWHSHTRRQTGLNDQLNLIALGSVPKLRHFLNKVVIDALLYAGPVYSQTIINNVADEINRLYTLFMEKHPNFCGSISLAGHSLGSVILFDLLANQKVNPDSPEVPLRPKSQTNGSPNNDKNNNNSNNDNNNNMDTGHYHITYPQLKFKPRCFFAFGSPMPMFLNVRGVRTIAKDYKLPTCDRMFNIFHPYDPLAYRLEPLIDPRFKNVEPVQVPHHRGGKRIHVQLREGFAKYGQSIKHRLLGSLKNTWTTFTKTATPPPSPIAMTKQVSPPESPNSPMGSSQESQRSLRLTKRASSSVELEVASFESAINMVLLKENDVNSSEKIENLRQHLEDLHHDEEATETSIEFDSTHVGLLNGGRRLDYVLQEKPIELFNEYIFAFTSHANYWQNEDSALILLNEIYKADCINVFDCFD